MDREGTQGLVSRGFGSGNDPSRGVTMTGRHTAARRRMRGAAARGRLDVERLEGRAVMAAGLTAEIFDNADFTALKATRVDPAINFQWGTAGPASGVGADTFSIRWSGRLTPAVGGTYTFFVTADDGFRLWIDGALVAARTTYVSPAVSDVTVPLRAGVPVGVRLEYIEQTGGASARLEWASPGIARQVVPASVLDTAPVEDDRGSILSEVWRGIDGSAIESLTGNAAYPNRPAERTYLTSFETLRAGQGDSYGRRVRGYLVAPTTGAYRFAISGDDRVRLLLGTDASPASAKVIAFSNDWTSPREFGKYATQQSAAITLVAGRRYYIEALQKEGIKNDHLAVAWQRPGDAAWSVIPGESLAPVGTTAGLPAESQILATLATGSRLLVSDEQFAATAAAAATNPDLQARLAALVKAADALLAQPVLAYVADVRGTILGDASKLVGRASTLGAAYRLTGNAAYAERLWLEVDAGAALADWHPAHFLDTAEMTNGMAIAYDWLRGYWSPERRTRIVDAIVAKGLQPGLSAYQANAWFFRDTSNNWALVTNGGMTMGALAVAGDQPTLAAQIVARSVPSARAVMRHYTADNGGWYEGPGYYNYSLRYGVTMMAALETALGTDFGLARTPGFERAGLAAILETGPTGASFNFADGGPGRFQTGPVGFWMARRFNRPEYAWYARTYGSTSDPLNLLWFDPRGTAPTAATLSGSAFLRGPAATSPYAPADVVTLRGGWESASTFVATKAGKVGDSHGNLDAGTFVLDALGQRWFHDLGADSYALPGYFSNPQRWTYYRMRAEGQNTLVINPGSDGGQVLGATPPVTLFRTDADGGRTVTDLTRAYAGVTSVRRGIAMVNGRRDVVVQDEIRATTPATVWWFGHVKLAPAQVQIAADGRSAILTQNGQRLWVGILAGPADAAFQLLAAAPLPTSPNPAGQNANADFMKLAVKMSGVTDARLSILFSPLAPEQNAPGALPVVTSLASWATLGTATRASVARLPAIAAGVASSPGTPAAGDPGGTPPYGREAGTVWLDGGAPGTTPVRPRSKLSTRR